MFLLFAHIHITPFFHLLSYEFTFMINLLHNSSRRLHLHPFRSPGPRPTPFIFENEFSNLAHYPLPPHIRHLKTAISNPLYYRYPPLRFTHLHNTPFTHRHLSQGRLNPSGRRLLATVPSVQISPHLRKGQLCAEAPDFLAEALYVLFCTIVSTILRMPPQLPCIIPYEGIPMPRYPYSSCPAPDHNSAPKGEGHRPRGLPSVFAGPSPSLQRVLRATRPALGRQSRERSNRCCPA